MNAMRRGFTLIELLVIIAIMGAMVTVGVVSLNSSRGSTGVFAAGRDVMAMVRRARSLALVTQESVVIIYSNDKDDDAACAKVELQAKKLFSSKKTQEAVRNLAGEIVIEASTDDGTEGETLEDVLSPTAVPTEVMKGLKIKVLDETDSLALPENETRRSKISIFSTAENLSRTLTAASAAPTTTTKSDDSAAEESEAPFKVAFAANGTVNPPHRIWIYREDSSPENGLVIHVDRFGEPKCERLDE